MALQSSGQIKLSEIATEFGGSAPHALSEYYGAASGVPASGQIKLGADFYGTTSSLISETQTNGQRTLNAKLGTFQIGFSNGSNNGTGSASFGSFPNRTLSNGVQITALYRSGNTFSLIFNSNFQNWTSTTLLGINGVSGTLARSSSSGQGFLNNAHYRFEFINIANSSSLLSNGANTTVTIVE